MRLMTEKISGLNTFCDCRFATQSSGTTCHVILGSANSSNRSIFLNPCKKKTTSSTNPWLTTIYCTRHLLTVSPLLCAMDAIRTAMAQIKTKILGLHRTQSAGGPFLQSIVQKWRGIAHGPSCKTHPNLPIVRNITYSFGWPLAKPEMKKLPTKPI